MLFNLEVQPSILLDYYYLLYFWLLLNQEVMK